jgi:hypothetical protein
VASEERKRAERKGQRSAVRNLLTLALILMKKRLAVEEADFRRARTLGRILSREFDALAFSQELEHRLADGGSMEEVFDAAFVPDEPEALVDE